jgi:hypothetical protein
VSDEAPESKLDSVSGNVVAAFNAVEDRCCSDEEIKNVREELDEVLRLLAIHPELVGYPDVRGPRARWVGPRLMWGHVEVGYFCNQNKTRRLAYILTGSDPYGLRYIGSFKNEEIARNAVEVELERLEKGAFA